MKIYKILDKVYNVGLIVLVGRLDEYVRYMARHGREVNRQWIVDAHVHAETWSVTIGGIAYKTMWLGKFDTSVWGMSLLVHEITHVVCEILATRGVRITPDDHEPYAYYAAFWMSEILTRLRRR